MNGLMNRKNVFNEKFSNGVPHPTENLYLETKRMTRVKPALAMTRPVKPDSVSLH